jgi:hypothetical protein
VVHGAASAVDSFVEKAIKWKEGTGAASEERAQLLKKLSGRNNRHRTHRYLHLVQLRPRDVVGVEKYLER